jgi:hypothetical protein
MLHKASSELRGTGSFGCRSKLVKTHQALSRLPQQSAVARVTLAFSSSCPPMSSHCGTFVLVAYIRTKNVVRARPHIRSSYSAEIRRYISSTPVSRVKFCTARYIPLLRTWLLRSTHRQRQTSITTIPQCVSLFSSSQLRHPRLRTIVQHPRRLPR